MLWSVMASVTIVLKNVCTHMVYTHTKYTYVTFFFYLNVNAQTLLK